MRGLRTSLQKISHDGITSLAFKQIKAKSNNLRFGSTFFIASLVSGINWYFQSAWAANETERQKTILNRVDSDNVREDYMKEFDYTKADQWDGQKIQLDGILYPSRFVVKRKRGDQEGYMVFAPYVIQKYPGPQVYKKPLRTIILNIGWVPKESKHLIGQAALVNAIPYNDYSENLPEAIEKSKLIGDRIERQSPDSDIWFPVSSISAYVRRGEQEDTRRGYKNWPKQSLFKFIDLSYMSKYFGIINNHEAQSVYFERIQPEDGQESIPIPTNKDIMLNEINRQISHIQQRRRSNVVNGASLSFLSAFILSAL